jgi:deoxycytidylate deaminase
MKWSPNFEITTDKKHVPYLRKAYEYGFNNSNDNNTRNGALLVENGEILVLGSCGIPEYLIDKPERHEQPVKYAYVKHAERNVIHRAAKKGIKTEGLTMYCPWYACTDCAHAIIASGIETVIGHESPFLRTPERWQKPIDLATGMLHEGKVETLMYRGKIGGVEDLLDGKKWEP